MTEENIQKFETGAVRSSDANSVRYDLISHIGLRRLAETYAEGAKKYSDHNWLKGFPMSDVMNHCIRHIQLWLSGDTSEDHLSHSAWNLFTLMHFEETRPDLNDIYHRQPKDTKTEISWEEIWKKCIDSHVSSFTDEPTQRELDELDEMNFMLNEGGY